MPVLDTLRLSPLAFPANPYHKLVKHYQDGGLVRGQINNPELDARCALDLLADEREALSRVEPDLLLAWHWFHGAIRQLVPGDPLSVRTDRTPWEITTGTGLSVGRLARQYKPAGQFHSAQVKAVVHWCRDDSEPDYQDHLRCNEWEVVVPEFVFS